MMISHELPKEIYEKCIELEIKMYQYILKLKECKCEAYKEMSREYENCNINFYEIYGSKITSSLFCNTDPSICNNDLFLKNIDNDFLIFKNNINEKDLLNIFNTINNIEDYKINENISEIIDKINKINNKSSFIQLIEIAGEIYLFNQNRSFIKSTLYILYLLMGKKYDFFPELYLSSSMTLGGMYSAFSFQSYEEYDKSQFYENVFFKLDHAIKLATDSIVLLNEYYDGILNIIDKAINTKNNTTIVNIFLLYHYVTKNFLQEKLNCSYMQASRYIDLLSKSGIIGDNGKKRDTKYYLNLDELIEECTAIRSINKEI